MTPTQQLWKVSESLMEAARTLELLASQMRDDQPSAAFNIAQDAPSATVIFLTCCAYFKLTPSDVMAKPKPKYHAMARQITTFLCMQNKIPRHELYALFKTQSRAFIPYAQENIGAQISTSREVCEAVVAIEKRLKEMQ